MNSSIISLFKRDLDRLKKEIEQYSNDTHFWKVEKDIKNSGGNLTIHLIGNLNHFIGATLGKTDFIRNREGEFNDKNIPRKRIIEDIDKVKTIIENATNSLSDTDLKKEFPLQVLGYAMTTEYFLIHLYGHLNYHLGQINYHRRLIE